jgi:hypothetical protein
MTKITLIPCDNELQYEWNEGIRYALVGKTSGEIHMIFISNNYENAKVIKDTYRKIMCDSGYHIMKVKEY